MTSENPQKKYRVIVADNYHYQDESENYTFGYFDTLEEAIGACMAIVDEYLEGEFKAGISSSAMYETYKNFGDDPYVVGADVDGVPFSAWSYAEQRCIEICA